MIVNVAGKVALPATKVSMSNTLCGLDQAFISLAREVQCSETLTCKANSHGNKHSSAVARSYRCPPPGPHYVAQPQ
jgi:hypothetical protein